MIGDKLELKLSDGTRQPLHLPTETENALLRQGRLARARQTKTADMTFSQLRDLTDAGDIGGYNPGSKGVGGR